MKKEKGIDLEALKAGKSAGIPFSVGLAPEKEDELEDTVRQLLKEDPAALTKVQKLNRTAETFSRSVGNLYTYLQDRKTCLSCKDGLLSCPKKRSGFRYLLSYDSERDEMALSLAPCSYQAEKERAFEKIRPMDRKGDVIFHDAMRLSDLVRNRPELRSTKKAYLDILLALDQIGKEEHFTLFAGNNEAPLLLIRFGCYLYARNGISCAYVRMKDLFLSLTSKDWDLRRQAEEDLADACRAEALFLEGADVLPYLSTEQADMYLYPLLKSQAGKGHVTFGSVTNPSPVDTYRRIFYRSTNLDAVMTIAQRFQEIAIDDLFL